MTSPSPNDKNQPSIPLKKNSRIAVLGLLVVCAELMDASIASVFWGAGYLLGAW